MMPNPKLHGYAILYIISVLTAKLCLSQVIHFGKCTLVLNASCTNEYVRFYLYTRQNLETPQLVYFGKEMNITSSFYQNNSTNKVIIHGFNADMRLKPLIDIKTGYLKKYDTNVWMIDWAKIAVGPCYISAIYNTRHVGKCLAQFIGQLKNINHDLDLHVIGFSLGAHAPATAVPLIKPYIIQRITGLDPAMPLVTLESKSHKLNRDQAQFVDVIHTNALMQGQIEPSGHADFYMNGGFLQPGCSAEKDPLNCDHHRAPMYFAESLTTNKGFWGWKCEGMVEYLLGKCPQEGTPFLLGEMINKITKGCFFVKTASESPFALGKWNST